MRDAIFAMALLLAALTGCDRTVTTFVQLNEAEFVPPNGKGRVVIVLSGSSGSGSYRFAARELAAQGYYVVLHSGHSFPSWNPGSRELLHEAIVRAQGSRNAIPGKVGIVGYSMGGGEVLEFASSMDDVVGVAIAYYPVTALPDRENVERRWSVPTLAFMGEVDNMAPVRLDLMHAMAESARMHGAEVDVVAYPATGHDFNWPGAIGGPVQPATDDSRRRTFSALQRYLGA